MKRFAGLCMACTILPTGHAGAADLISASAPGEAPVEANWTFSVTPYFWAAGLSGETSQFGLPVVVDIDASFSDIFDNLDFAAMAIAEARNGPYSIFGDLIYTKLSARSDTPLGLFADSAEVEASTFAGLVAAGCSVLDGPSGRLDIVGVRVWSVDTDISFSGAFLNGETRSDGATWVDGLVGLRGNFRLHAPVLRHGLGTRRRRPGGPRLGPRGRHRLPHQRNVLGDARLSRARRGLQRGRLPVRRRAAGTD